jgi:16S rRNA (cytidine1402-2'-O)-methyltransferase
MQIFINTMYLKPGLYLVATPIGNLEDITLRALDILKNSDIVLCEDTRTSQKLLAKHNIKAGLQIYNDHSNERARVSIINSINAGKIISLISDAGTPLISDPGYKLVKEVQNLGLFVDIAPGPCSVIAALSLSFLEPDKFFFGGFLPKTTQGKNKIFSSLLQLEATLIFFESPNRLLDTLKTAYSIFGNRKASVAREITKLYQEVKTCGLKELVDFYEHSAPRGEIVLLISKNAEIADQDTVDQGLQRELKLFFTHGISPKTASEIIAPRYKTLYSKAEIYRMANKIKESEILDLKN